MPRSAFLEGARSAGGTETFLGAAAKQKTAVPQGAASLSLAVLENDGRKRGSDMGIGEAGLGKDRKRTGNAESHRSVRRDGGR